MYHTGNVVVKRGWSTYLGMVLIEKGRRKLRQRQLYANFQTSSKFHFIWIGNFYIILRKTIHVIIKVGIRLRCLCCLCWKGAKLVFQQLERLIFAKYKSTMRCNQSKTDEWICSIKMPMRIWVSITKVFNNSLLRISKLQIKIDHV